MPGGGAPVGSTASKTTGQAQDEPVSLVRDIGAATIRTQQVVLTDDEPVQQLFPADPTRRSIVAMYVDPDYAGDPTRVFITGSATDANQRRNGVPLSTAGPIYGLADIELAGAVYAYADPASDGTLNANGGLYVFVAHTTGQATPTDLVNQPTEGETYDEAES